MTDAQIITLALVFVAAIGSIMFNNSRITDLRIASDNRSNDMRDSMNKRFDDMQNGMNKRFDDVQNGMNKRFDDVNRHIDDKFALMSQQMTRMEENIMRILGDHETRIQKLEHPTDR